MKNSIVPASLVFGVSLFSISLWASQIPITIAVSDVVIGLVLLYSLIRVRRMAWNPMSNATILLAIVIFLSGSVNAWLDPTFDTTNFLTNYVRIIGLVAMMLLLPPMLRRVGHDRLARGTMWALRLQCALLLADVVSLLPASWSLTPEWSLRPSGLFAEPGWFGVWAGLSVFYVMQVQRNLKRQYIASLDIGVLAVSVVASTGMRGIILIGFAFAGLMGWKGMRTRLRVVGGLLLSGVLLVSAIAVFPDSGPVWAWNYVIPRALGLSPANLTDESALERIAVSTRLAVVIITNAPVLGTGLGGVNNRRLELTYYDPTLPPPSTATTLTAFLEAGGVPGLLLFLFILYRMIVVTETRWMGFGFAVVAVIWGGAFESFIWWNIALAVALRGTHKETASKLAHPEELRTSRLTRVADKSSVVRIANSMTGSVR